MSAGLKHWKPYPEYKDSGVEWLGEVPAGWKISRSLFYFDFVTSGSRAWAQFYADVGSPFVRIGNIMRDSIHPDFSTLMYVEAPTGMESERATIKQNDIFISITADIGSVGIATPTVEGGYISQHIALCRPNKRSVIPRYLAYALSSAVGKNQLLSFSYGGTKVQLNLTDIKNIHLALPSLHEQQAIADCLDALCAHIDSLIEKKQRLLELLDEKRRAVITQAVTRGLDPTVPLKDSGVEWLGMVPEGWEVKRLKFCVKSGFQYGANIAAGLDDPSLPRYIRITDMNDDGTLKDETFRSLPVEEASQYLLRDKDILLARSGATVGKSFIYYEKMGLAAYAGYLIRISASEDVSPSFLYSFLNSQAYWQWVRSIFIQATIQNVSAEKYANFVITSPPRPEQQAIADYLDAQCASMDSQRKSLEKSIDLLREYRASLITHAVTGKIDVRDYAPLQ